MLHRTQDRDMDARPLHILIIDANRIRASIIEEGLTEAGPCRVTVVHDNDRLMQRIVEIDPDVIVVDLVNPNRDALEDMFRVSRAVRRPVAMFVDRFDQREIEAAIEAGVSAYIVDGLVKERVKSILDTAIVRFRAFDRMREELEQARSALNERKIIDRAKGILMRRRGLAEDQAYGLLRRTAMNQNRRIVEVAEGLVMAADLLGGEDRS
jgi:response regulator NasT